MERSEASIKEYIYTWLSNLGIGPVFMDRKAFDDTTKIRQKRSYIVVDFPDGIIDMGPWYEATCVVFVGCRDKERFVPDYGTLDAVCGKFKAEFDRNDDIEGISCIDVEYIDDYPNIDNHEYQYQFDIYARKWVDKD